MMNDDTLMLYFYEEGLSDSERRDVALALEHDAELSTYYAALCRDLEQLREAPSTDAPQHLKHQWHAMIAQAAQLERGKAATTPPRGFHWGWLGTAAATVMVAFVIGTQFGHQPDPAAIRGTTLAADSTDGNVAAGAFSRGLQVYLENASVDLERLQQRSPDDQAALIAEIVRQNRMFELAAESRNVSDVARLMRAIEPVLLQLASDDISAAEADALRMQLSFELNALLTKVAQSTSEVTETI
ncbi:MAG: hypothetical protein AAF270_14340 [Pseudomonadota bacterium]